MKEYSTSPIFYMGNKKKLINRGLIELFPKNINTFYDLFCGSGVVTMNTEAISYEVNDINSNITDLIQWFCYYTPEEIIERIDELIKKYELPTFSTDTRKYKGDREIFKEKYNKLRSDYNTTRSVELLYLLNIFSNSHMIRFNSNGDFNMPFGNGYFTEETKDAIKNNNYEKIIYISHVDFREYAKREFEKDDFIYLDPPYLDTTATYNENGGWTIKDEKDLQEFCDKLTENGIKWGMSNVYENKGIVNSQLKEWQEQKGYSVYFFDNFTYCSCGKGNSNTKEVFICNY